MSRAPRFVFSALLALSLAVGCGDSDSTAIDSASEKAKFIQQANAICKRGSAEFIKKAAPIIRQEGQQPEIVTQRKLVQAAVAPTFEAEIREIRALGPPANDEEVEAILSAMQNLVNQLEQDPLSRGRYPYRGVEDLAAGYGLSACGHP